jgi:WD40 repeat protein
LEFSPTDSNILASGEYKAIKLWNIEQEACIYEYRFDHRWGYIRSLCFPVQDKGQKCIFVTAYGSLIRTWWGNDLSDIESDIVNMPELDRVQVSAFSHCGSLLAVAPGDENRVRELFQHPLTDKKNITLYNMITMTVVQTLSIHHDRNMHLANNCFAFSPDDKSLVLRINTNEIQICEVTDLNIRRLLRQQTSAHDTSSGAVTFDPSGQVLASVGGTENVRIWTL